MFKRGWPELKNHWKTGGIYRHNDAEHPMGTTSREIDIKGARIDDAMRYWLKQIEKKGKK